MNPSTLWGILTVLLVAFGQGQPLEAVKLTLYALALVSGLVTIYLANKESR